MLTALTFHAYAASYSVHANVKAVTLTKPATITSPTNSWLSVRTITVSGTCPVAWNDYVNLTDNGVFAGTAYCGSNGRFNIRLTLRSGVNRLQAQDYNSSNIAGPTSPRVIVVCTLPSMGGTFYITSDYAYTVQSPGVPTTFTIHIIGGIPPYRMTIDWGDGSRSTLIRQTGADVVIRHTYGWTTAAITSMIINVQATDASGAASTLQLDARIRNTVFAGNSANTTSGGMLGSVLRFLSSWLWLLWPGYGIILLLVISFWLGEWQERSRIKAKHERELRRRRARYATLHGSNSR